MREGDKVGRHLSYVKGQLFLTLHYAEPRVAICLDFYKDPEIHISVARAKSHI